MNYEDPSGFKISNIDAIIVIAMFVTYYIVDEVLNLSSKYTVACKNIVIDKLGAYIVKIYYYKNALFKKKFVLTLGDRETWEEETNINNNLNMEFVQNQANYIQSEYNKGPTGLLTGTGPNVYGINIASATVAMHLIHESISVYKMKRKYNRVWGKKRIVYGKYKNYYLFNITKGGKLNGWYAYNYKTGSVTKV